ncbi:MAG: glycosyltransferase, partial [Candidatus Omnitrophota bacterium]|nr:glycosyltransferase [Candidatus Omnitrophota bacterium]
SGWYMISEMLDFFKVMKDKLRNSRFIFLTDDKDGQLAHLTTEKGISCVDIIKVSYNDVPVYLSDATAGLLFKWPNERLDSFPIKIGEYLASGLPIIINAGMGDVEELILRNRIGVVVKSCDEASYLKAIGDLGILLREGAALRKRCSDIAAKYLSSSFGILQYENIYKRYFFPQK